MIRQGLLFSWSQRPGPGSSDRRASPRYPVVQNRAFLSCRKATETRQCPARLLNISSGGALIIAEQRPERGLIVWLRLEAPMPTERVEANVVGVVKVPGLLWFRKASYIVRMSFIESCPYDLFKSATHGHQLDATNPEPTLSEFDIHFRR